MLIGFGTDDNANRLELHADDRHDGYYPYRVRWHDTTDAALWDIHTDQSDNLRLTNEATGTTTAWAAPDDVFHVQDLVIEGNSSIDAGTLDGLDSAQFLRSDISDTTNGDLDVQGTLSETGNPVLTTADEGSLDAGTLGGATLTQTRPEVTDDGSQIEAGPSSIDFGQYLEASADGDGTITVDSLGGNAVGDTTTTSGDGSTTTFTLTHGLGITPVSVDVTPLTEDASADHWVSAVRDTDLDVTYSGAPPSGTDNLSWHVTAVGNDGSATHAVQLEDAGSQIGLADTLNFDTALAVSSPSDGRAAINWASSITDSGAEVAVGPDTITFGQHLSATGDGSGGVTIDGQDTYPSVSNNGSVVESAPTDINTGSRITASSDGDGTVTLTTPGDANTLDGIDSNQFLRSDVGDIHRGQLSLTELGAADATSVDVVHSLAVAENEAVENTSGSSYYALTPRRSGLQSLTNGSNLPTDSGMALEMDATLAFLETDNDRVSGWVDTNSNTLTMAGGIRVGDAGGAPDGVTLDVRGEARLQVENRTSDPSNPEPGQLWFRTDLIS
jgi:hypothetical protein